MADISTVRGSTEFCSGSEPRLFCIWRVQGFSWLKKDGCLPQSSLGGKEHAQLVHFKHCSLRPFSPHNRPHFYSWEQSVFISRTLDGTRYTLIQCLTPAWPQVLSTVKGPEKHWCPTFNSDSGPAHDCPLELGIHILLLAHTFMFCKSGSWQLLGNADVCLASQV